jgi:hypothetical protein
VNPFIAVGRKCISLLCCSIRTVYKGVKNGEVAVVVTERDTITRAITSSAFPFMVTPPYGLHYVRITIYKVIVLSFVVNIT